jgi:3-deoxy-D-manno-octulosonic-acid transferase
VAALCVDAGLAVERRSQCREPRLAPGGVLLLDTVGELSSLYRLAHVVFVGGSLVPVGGHDPWLPLRAGCALLLGPHQEEQPEAQSQLVAADPSMCVRDAASLSSALCDRLAEPRGSRMEKVLAELPRPGSALALQLGWLSEWIG